MTWKTVHCVFRWLARSLAIMSDAGHMVSDFISFLISIFAIRTARTLRMLHFIQFLSFGLHMVSQLCLNIVCFPFILLTVSLLEREHCSIANS